LCGKTMHPMDGVGVQPTKAGEAVKPLPATAVNYFDYCPDCLTVHNHG